VQDVPGQDEEQKGGDDAWILCPKYMR